MLLFWQLLFARLNSISEAAEVAFIDRGVVTPLLARLLEVFVIYMDEDKFWSTIEDCPSRIGPTGLKQVNTLFTLLKIMNCGEAVFIMNFSIQFLSWQSIHVSLMVEIVRVVINCEQLC